jgi:hypothetical protein
MGDFRQHWNKHKFSHIKGHPQCKNNKKKSWPKNLQIKRGKEMGDFWPHWNNQKFSHIKGHWLGKNC